MAEVRYPPRGASITGRIDVLAYSTNSRVDELECTLKSQMKQKERLIKRHAWKHPRKRGK